MKKTVAIEIESKTAKIIKILASGSGLSETRIASGLINQRLYELREEAQLVSGLEPREQRAVLAAIRKGREVRRGNPRDRSTS